MNDIHAIIAAATPGPWHYEAGGGHAYNQLRGSDSVQTNGWPERRDGVSNASYSDRICENLGDTALPGPRANIALLMHAITMAEALARIAANACCDKCQEAALVARDCLDQIVKEAP